LSRQTVFLTKNEIASPFADVANRETSRFAIAPTFRKVLRNKISFMKKFILDTRNPAKLDILILRLMQLFQNKYFN